MMLRKQIKASNKWVGRAGATSHEVYLQQLQAHVRLPHERGNSQPPPRTPPSGTCLQGEQLRGGGHDGGLALSLLVAAAASTALHRTLRD